MSKAKIHPTCRICVKMNAEMTHCAIFGYMTPANVDSTAIGAACSKSGDYIRHLHAVPNEYNHGKVPGGKLVNEKGDSQLLIYDAADESKGFQIQNGMSLEEWANYFFENGTTHPKE